MKCGAISLSKLGSFKRHLYSFCTFPCFHFPLSWHCTDASFLCIHFSLFFLSLMLNWVLKQSNRSIKKFLFRRDLSRFMKRIQSDFNSILSQDCSISFSSFSNDEFKFHVSHRQKYSRSRGRNENWDCD